MFQDPGGTRRNPRTPPKRGARRAQHARGRRAARDPVPAVRAGRALRQPRGRSRTRTRSIARAARPPRRGARTRRGARPAPPRRRRRAAAPQARRTLPRARRTRWTHGRRRSTTRRSRCRGIDRRRRTTPPTVASSSRAACRGLTIKMPPFLPMRLPFGGSMAAIGAQNAAFLLAGPALRPRSRGGLRRGRGRNPC